VLEQQKGKAMLKPTNDLLRGKKPKPGVKKSANPPKPRLKRRPVRKMKKRRVRRP
jgi:hypothetical protein